MQGTSYSDSIGEGTGKTFRTPLGSTGIGAKTAVEACKDPANQGFWDPTHMGDSEPECGILMLMLSARPLRSAMCSLMDFYNGPGGFSLLVLLQAFCDFQEVSGRTKLQATHLKLSLT